MKIPFEKLLIASASLFLSEAVSASSIFTGFHSFGDSLTDSGNVFTASNGAFGYPGGRFSDGPIWAEQLATEYLGLASHTPTIFNGTNHAWGGARTADVVPPLELSTIPPSISRQISFYVGSGGSFSSGDLVSIWGGPNDFIDSIDSGLGTADPATSAATIGSSIDAVIAAGAEHVMILNVPDLGDTPSYRNGPFEAVATTWTDDFNAALASEVIARESADVTLYFVDIHALGADFQANPEDYNLLNVVDPVFPDNLLDPTTTAFWDDLHPTQAVHEIFAREAAIALGIPEPSSIFLILASPALLMTRRQRLA